LWKKSRVFFEKRGSRRDPPSNWLLLLIAP
jgi:hypothetical protein